MTFVWGLAGFLCSLVSHFFFMQVSISMRCALPIIKMLKSTDNICQCVNVRSAKSFYAWTVIINLAICAGITYLIFLYAPATMGLWYIVGFAFQFITSFFKCGKTQANVGETYNMLLKKFVHSGYEDDFTQRFNYAVSDAPSFFPAVKVILIVWLLGGFFAGAFLAKNDILITNSKTEPIVEVSKDEDYSGSFKDNDSDHRINTVSTAEDRLVKILEEIYDESNIEAEWEIVPYDGWVEVRLTLDGTAELMYDASRLNVQEAIDEWNGLMSILVDINIEDNKIASESGYPEITVTLSLTNDLQTENTIVMIAGGDVLYDPVNGINILEQLEE